jgi:hypothetical protein
VWRALWMSPHWLSPDWVVAFSVIKFWTVILSRKSGEDVFWLPAILWTGTDKSQKYNNNGKLFCLVSNDFSIFWKAFKYFWIKRMIATLNFRNVRKLKMILLFWSWDALILFLNKILLGYIHYMGGFIVTILIRRILYIIYIAPIVSPLQPPPHST